MASVIIGVAALVATLAIGNGAKIVLQQQLESLGKDTIYVFGGSKTVGGVRGGLKAAVRLDQEDWRAVQQLPTIQSTAPCVWVDVQVVYGSSNWGCEATGTTPTYLEIMGSHIASGRAFTSDEVTSGAAVVLLGNQVREKLFGVEDAVGKTVRIGQFPFLVVGLLQAKGLQGWRSDDSQVLLPYTTAQRRLQNTTTFTCLMCQARRGDQLKQVTEQIKATLRALNNCRPDDEDAFYASSTEQWMKSRTETSSTFSAFTLLTALVSLLVGGLGITNTMMMSVTERTREIGVRTALGARARDIHGQFLCEAILLSGAGGVLGVLLGVFMSFEAAEFAAWPLVLTPWAMLGSVAAASGVGVVAGFYPAWKAAAMDPVDALRAD